MIKIDTDKENSEITQIMRIIAESDLVSGSIDNDIRDVKEAFESLKSEYLALEQRVFMTPLCDEEGRLLASIRLKKKKYQDSKIKLVSSLQDSLNVYSNFLITELNSRYVKIIQSVKLEKPTKGETNGFRNVYFISTQRAGKALNKIIGEYFHILKEANGIYDKYRNFLDASKINQSIIVHNRNYQRFDLVYNKKIKQFRRR